jgi:phospholipid/cholesterol/gamma-HCH transport system permease protein
MNNFIPTRAAIAKNQIHLEHPPGTDLLILRFSGSWTLSNGIPPADEITKALATASNISRAVFDTTQLTAWDSVFLAFLKKVLVLLDAHPLQVKMVGLPTGVQQLLSLSAAVPEKEASLSTDPAPSLLTRIGEIALTQWTACVEMVGFIGEATLAFLKLFSGKAGFRRIDLLCLLQECGIDALAIVSLISILVGLILAFVGVIQLKLFGAQIFVADLVGIGMAREMGAMMTAIIMAGRTGAAFAAQLGTMVVNEEIDALSTMGISPMEFLVLPRMLALILMLPLLCVYANLMGILGGAIVGCGMFDISAVQYYDQTRNAVGLMDFSIGVCKSGVFGVIVAIAGCFRGMQCGRSASAVGLAATSAVVTAIIFIVISDSVMTVICSVLGI